MGKMPVVWWGLLWRRGRGNARAWSAKAGKATVRNALAWNRGNAGVSIGGDTIDRRTREGGRMAWSGPAWNIAARRMTQQAMVGRVGAKGNGEQRRGQRWIEQVRSAVVRSVMAL